MLNLLKRATIIGLIAASQLAHAQAPPAADVLAFDGNGSLTLNGLGVAVLGQLQPDAGPGGLPAALTFTLLLPLGPALSQPVLGDLLVYASGGGALSDVVRFNPGFGLVFYSDLDAAGPPQLADTGLPGSLYGNQASITEGQLYIPGLNQPGYAINLVTGLPLAYAVVSEASAVPEPGSLPLLGAGLVGVMAVVVRRRRREAACWPVRRSQVDNARP